MNRSILFFLSLFLFVCSETDAGSAFSFGEQPAKGVPGQGNQGFAKASLPDYFKLRIEGMTFFDETVIRFHPQATNGFDGNFDAFKLFSSNQQAANISSVSMGNDYMVNTLPQQNLNLSIPVRAKIGTSGAYTIFFQQVDSMDASVCLLFQDLITGVQLDMRQQSSYSFSANDTSWWPRFRVRLSGALSYSLSDEGCPGDNNGTVVLSNPTSLNWNLTLQDLSGGIVGSQSGTAQSFVFDQLAPGQYVLISSGGSGCPVPVDTLFIPPGNAVNSAFTSNEDTVYLSGGGSVQFTAQQSGATSWLWDFGDGNTNDTLLNPLHTYTQPGQYLVRLISVNGGCTDTSSMLINVLLPVSLSESNNGFSCFFSSEEGVLYYAIPGSDAALLQIFDLSGKRVLPTIILSADKQSLRLPVEGLSPGLYFCTLEHRGLRHTLKFMLP